MQVQNHHLTNMSPLDFGCCDFQLKAKNGAVFCARSMEFPMPMESQLLVYNRDETYSSLTPDGAKGLEWKSKYGFVGINAFHLEGPDEGINEAGLSFGFLSLKGSKYQSVSENQKDHALALMDVGTWILGNFATIDEVKEGLKNVRIWGDFVKPLHEVPGLHIALHDSTGKSGVIEFIDGEAVFHENPLGVLTNEPPFDAQIQNLSRYNGLSNETTEDITINGTIIPTTGIGSGMVGLPGDWSSITRFVRIASAVRFALQPQNESDCIQTATHNLNMVDIPPGLVTIKTQDSLSIEKTLWSVIKDLANKIFYYRSCEDMTLRKVDLKEINFTKGTKHHKLTIQTKEPTIIDVTKKL